MMEDMSKYQSLADACKNLLFELPCDFIGLAIQDPNGPNVKWHYALGNENDKYKRITVRYGKGIAGKVISTGSPMKVDDFPKDIVGKPVEYPIMLAEKLVSSYAVPIAYESFPKGTLLVGRRSYKPFSGHEQVLVLKTVKALEKILIHSSKE
jgi:nitrogen regulatory protein A